MRDTPTPPKGSFNTNPPSPPDEAYGTVSLYEGGITANFGRCIPVFKSYLQGGFSRVSIFCAFCLLLSSCTQQVQHKAIHRDAVTQIDSITVYSDEAFRYLIDQEITIYEYEQPDQHIHVVYKPEAEVLKAMMTDSFSSAILGRKLTDKETQDLYRNSNIQVDEHPFATEAIAIIAGRKFDRDTLSYDAILALLRNTSHDYDLVFDSNGSGVINYMFSQIAHSSVHPSAFAAKGINDLVEYVQKDTKGLGFIPFTLISDEDSRDARDLLKKVKLLYISKADSSGSMHASTASQSEIADGSYPFDRPICVISHSMNDRVGTGFVNYLNREQSGRIILKSGLVPLVMPTRLINVHTDEIK
jgi:phosphate transport system substrate-binding protein